MKNVTKLEEMNAGQLIEKTAFPLMLSLVLEGIGTLVDGIFLSALSSRYLTAISLANPVLIFLNAVSAGIGSGTSAVLSRVLGRNRPGEKQNYILSALLLSVLLWIPFALFGWLGTGLFLDFFTASAFTKEAASLYLKIQCIGCLSLFFMDVVQKLLLASVHTAAGLMGHILAAVLNLILDPLLIFGFGPVPSLKIAGAALASVLSQCAGIVLYIMLNRKFNEEFPLRLEGARPSLSAMKEIGRSVRHAAISHGLPSLMNLGLNKMLGGWSEEAIAFFGIFNKLENVCMLPVESLEEALVPAASFNAAAEKCGRVRAVFREALRREGRISLFTLAVLELLAPWILSFYHADAALLSIGIRGLRILAVSLLLSSFSSLTSSLFTAASKEPLSVQYTLLSKILLLFPLCWVFSRWLGLDGIWWGYVLSSAAGALFCLQRLHARFGWKILGLFRKQRNQ